jgi:acyl-CoA synthetase (AMP-forming)/AMP-acid ligase II/acyl carrier protein
MTMAPPTEAAPCPDILSLLRLRAAAHPERPAIEEADGERLSYARLLARTEGLAAALRARGASAGDRSRLGIVLPNGPAMSQALLAVTCVGTALPFNPAYTEAEFESYFRDTGLSALLTRPAFAPAAAQVATRLGIPLFDLDALQEDSHGADDIPTPAPDSIAMVLMTSGSTGAAKRVPLSHRNVCASARHVVSSMRLGADDRCLSMWELYHIGGLVDLLLAPLDAGGTVIATAGFDARRFFDLLARARPTWFQGVPATLGELALQARRGGIDPRGSSLRLIRSVAAALPPALMAELETLFGLPVLQTFGMTEAGPLITSTALPPASRAAGSVGQPCGTELRIFASDGTPVVDGAEGEVAIRGPNVFAGYEGDTAANADAFLDGWFRTGDLGRIDAAGNLYLTGRIKELVNRGGEKVNLREVDDALLRHPSVREAASFPVTHRTLGEDVAAAVVLQPGAAATPAELRAFASGRLAAFKVPRRIVMLDALPRNAVGKIDRRALESVADGLAAAAFGDRVRSSATEARLAAIWGRELDLPRVGIDDDFAGLGGDSLSALRVLLAIEQELGRTLPDDALANDTTVRALARALDDAPVSDGAGSVSSAGGLSRAARQRILTVIGTGAIPPVAPGSMLKIANRSGTRRPLIWFFNVPGSEMTALARRLPPDLPLYGGFSGAGLFDWDDEMAMSGIAALYAAELLDRFPHGSFAIGGNCQGGRVGWMVAKLLQQAGRGVDTLCFVEFSDPELMEFDGRLLMLFGKQSAHRHYRPIRWGRRGWDSRFRRQPVVSWIDGAHGSFWRDDAVPGLADALLKFLDGTPARENTLDSVAGRVLMFIHRTPRLFSLYRACHQIGTRLRSGT